MGARYNFYLWKIIPLLAVCLSGMLVSYPNALAEGQPPTQPNSDGCVDLSGKGPNVTELLKLVDEAPGQDLRRLAIVVGNNYPHNVGDSNTHKMPELKNAINDAAATAKLLLALKFKVVCVTNVNAVTFDRLLLAVAEKKFVGGGGLTFFYFAGHGFANDRDTWLVGDGAGRDFMATLERGSLMASFVVSSLRSRGAAVVAIFDMCREVLRLSTDEGMRALNGKSALDTYRPQSPSSSVLIQYTTSARGLARDLPEKQNGLYARVFLDITPREPGVSVDRLLNSMIGDRLARGIDIDGQLFSQEPNLVSYPGDWGSVALYDVAAGSRLEKLFKFMRDVETSIETWPSEFICWNLLKMEGLYSAASDPAAPPRPEITVANLLLRAKAVRERLHALGVECPENREVPSPALTDSSVFLPPVSHVPRSTVLAEQLGPDGRQIVSLGREVTFVTPAIILTLDKTTSGFSYAYKSPLNDTMYLDTGYAAVKADGGLVKVFSGPLTEKLTEIISTSDQVVVKFRPDDDEFTNVIQSVAELKELVIENPSAQFILLFPSNAQGPAANLEMKRLTFGRIQKLLGELVIAGAKFSAISLPELDQSPSVMLNTLQDNEALIKRVNSTTSALPFSAFDVEKLKRGEFGTAATKLGGYVAANR